MVCPVARRLLRSYHRASLAFREASEVVLSGIEPKDPRFVAARSVMATASEALHTAQREYWNHARDHRCSKQFSPADLRQTDEKLREDMIQARKLFDQAIEKYYYLMALRADIGFGPDGDMAMQQASHVRIRAYTLYLEALRRYADYTMLGELAEEPETEAGRHAKPN